MENIYNSPQRIYIYFSNSTMNKITLIAKINSYPKSYIAVSLAAIAIKYNYNSNLNYIPCQPLSTQINNTQPSKSIRLRVSLPVKLANTIHSIMQLYNYPSLSQTVNALIETALIYDYDDNLFFHAPTPISNINHINNFVSNNLFLLDKI